MNDDEPLSTEGSSLLAHLEALRKTLLASLLSVGIAFAPGYFLAPHLIRWLIRRILAPGLGALHYFSPMEAFMAELKTGLILALILAYPYYIHRIWRFLLPALYPEERRAMRFWLLASGILFFCGVFFCIFCVLPLVMRFAAGFATEELTPLLGLKNVLSFAFWLIFAFGLMFQTPLAVLLAVRFGLVRAQSLSKGRPYVILLLLIAAAFLTPPDVVSQLMLFLPTWFLFELGLFFAHRLKVREHIESAVSSSAPPAAAHPDPASAVTPDAARESNTGNKESVPPAPRNDDDAMAGFYRSEATRAASDPSSSVSSALPPEETRNSSDR